MGASKRRDVTCPECGVVREIVITSTTTELCRKCARRVASAPIGKCTPELARHIMTDYAADIRKMRSQGHSLKQMRRTA